MKTFDIEVLKNYVLFAFMDKKGKVSTIEIKGGKNSLTPKDALKLRAKLAIGTIVTFNGINYDMVITAGALAGLPVKDLYLMSQRIIVDGVPHWKMYRGTIKELTWCDHIDLIEPAPDVRIGLKLYGARLFSKRLWEYDVDWDKKVSKKDMKGLKQYCINDLILTWDLYRKIEPSIKLREKMSKQYDIDLRSKSDAQVAEAVIVSELGFDIRKAKIPKDVSYEAPNFIKFKSPELKRLVKQFNEYSFEVNQGNGKPMNPDWLKDTVIRLGEAQFQVGLGGLHSMEKSITVISDKKRVMRNADVASFYPRIIINSQLFPPQLTRSFLDVYINIVETRLKAKATGDKGTSETLKIVINGSFGKFGSKYSKLFAPHLLLAVTITGQLALLMLIEELELNEIPVISANTDGVEYLCPRNKIKLADKIIKKWEKRTGYTMDSGEYVSLHARDVNNYIAKYDDHVKSKGSYKRIDDMPILKKNPQVPICYTAVRDYIENGTPIEKTIRACDDVSQFASARVVRGGATFKGEKVGKTVRWYYNKSGECMRYVNANATGNHNKVPLTDDATPIMDLPNELPCDIDYDWYFRYAIEQYNLLGGMTYEKSLQAITKKAKK